VAVSDTVWAILIAAALAVVCWLALRIRRERAVRERLFGEEEQPPAPIRARRRSRALPLLFVTAVGVAAGLVVLHVIGWGTPFAVAFGFLFGISTLLVLSFFSGMRSVKLQTQLADAIDLMVGSLQAGAGLMDAILSAQQESRNPLRRRLDNLLVRIRIGENPGDVCRALGNAAEQESFRLFYSTLSVQWQSGGSVAPVLSDVGRFVRDHLETLRRVRGQMAEVRLSVLGVLALTYLLGLVIWRAHPERLEGFLSLELGQGLAAFALGLQALGVFWIYRLSKIRY
jgi:Flp pilus assembly protein TadB